MKECPVGNKVFYSYYSKQNYFNLRVNTILHQHDPLSLPIWWSNYTDPISKHELDNEESTEYKPEEPLIAQLPSLHAYKWNVHMF